jgi:hypothetical protein
VRLAFVGLGVVGSVLCLGFLVVSGVRSVLRSIGVTVPDALLSDICLRLFVL